MAAVLAEWPAAAMSPSLVSRVRAGVCVCVGGGRYGGFMEMSGSGSFPLPSQPHLKVTDT